MDTTTCTTIVLILLWLYLCCQALGSLVAPIYNDSTNEVVYSTFTVSTILLGICLWQCKKAEYLVSPMTWYHWVLLILLVLLQVLAVTLVVSEKLGWGIVNFLSVDSEDSIYGISATIVIMLGILGGTLFCGWKCNLFCRPCCKSQYICYGSAIVVVLVVLILLAMTASMVRYLESRRGYGAFQGDTQMWTIDYFCKMVLPCIQCYTLAVLWNTTLKLPYTLPEVVTLVSSALAVASLLALGVLGKVLGQENTKVYSILSLHLVDLGITWYSLEYKATFCCPKQYLCLGIFLVVLVIALVEVVITNTSKVKEKVDIHKYILLGYSIVLIAPTLWYAYRCGLFTWCLPKKKGLKADDTADNTIPDSDIAEE